LRVKAARWRADGIAASRGGTLKLSTQIQSLRKAIRSCGRRVATRAERAWRPSPL